MPKASIVELAHYWPLQGLGEAPQWMLLHALMKHLFRSPLQTVLSQDVLTAAGNVAGDS